jgi:uncharacterized phage protein gp47/JayE
MALFTVPSRETLHQEGLSDYAASQPTKSVSRGSTPYLLLRAVSGLVWSVLAKLLFFDKQRLPDTADDAYLQRWENVYSFPRLGAVGASRALALRCTGTVAAAVTVDSLLTHADGTIYKVTSVGAVIGGGGTVDVNVAAVSTGLATNKIAGELLTFSSPPVNVDAVATLVLDLAGGVDVEGVEAYRARFLAHLGDPPSGGAIPDYIEWALQVPGNATAYVWRNRRGLGTIDVAVLGSGHGADREITDLGATQDYLDDESRRPGNVKDVLVLGTTPQTQAVKISISVDETKYSWDWLDDGVGYNVTAKNIGTSTITVPTAPATVVAGVRITVNGEEATVTARVSNDLTLSFAPDLDENPVTWFTAEPVGSNLRASGDLVTPVRNAVLFLFDRLGPARDTRYAQTQWEAALQTDSLITAARNVLGCTKATLITPVADVTPVDALNDSITVPFLVPGNVEIVKL